MKEIKANEGRGMSEDISIYTDKIATEVKEEFDRFVFTTVKPYCEEVAKMEISKADLEEALKVWKSYKEGAFECKTGKWITDGCLDKCSCCGVSRDDQLYDNYCGNCGAKMEGAE